MATPLKLEIYDSNKDALFNLKVSRVEGMALMGMQCKIAMIDFHKPTDRAYTSFYDFPIAADLKDAENLGCFKTEESP